MRAALAIGTNEQQRTGDLMSTRRFKLKEGSTQVTPCPTCSNRLEFTAHSVQTCEDSCDVWIVCKCGFDPTFDRCGFRFEDVWGGVGDENVIMAISVWNDLIGEQRAA